jgi:hypothetical protein
MSTSAGSKLDDEIKLTLATVTNSQMTVANSFMPKR